MESVFPELTPEENAEIDRARSTGFATFYPCMPSAQAQATNTLKGAREHNANHCADGTIAELRQKRALQLLFGATRGHFVIWELAGDGNKLYRQAIMSELAGKKVPLSKCGVTAITEIFYAMAGSALDGYTCEANREDKFRAWAKAQLQISA